MSIKPVPVYIPRTRAGKPDKRCTPEGVARLQKLAAVARARKSEYIKVGKEALRAREHAALGLDSAPPTQYNSDDDDTSSIAPSEASFTSTDTMDIAEEALSDWAQYQEYLRFKAASQAHTVASQKQAHVPPQQPAPIVPPTPKASAPIPIPQPWGGRGARF